MIDREEVELQAKANTAEFWAIVLLIVGLVVGCLIGGGITSKFLSDKYEQEIKTRSLVTTYTDPITHDSALIWKSDSVVIRRY